MMNVPEDKDKGKGQHICHFFGWEQTEDRKIRWNFCIQEVKMRAFDL